MNIKIGDKIKIKHGVLSENENNLNKDYRGLNGSICRVLRITGSNYNPRYYISNNAYFMRNEFELYENDKTRVIKQFIQTI